MMPVINQCVMDSNLKTVMSDYVIVYYHGYLVRLLVAFLDPWHSHFAQQSLY
jgi:hypothetical protein